jgi:hypothetical protein
MPSRPTDIAKIVVENDGRLGDVEKKVSIHHEQISVLEKQASNMSALPTTVALMGQKLESLDKSMIREVDGLREQQKAHQITTAENMQKGFKEISEKVDGVVGRVNGVVLVNARQRGWWDVLQTAGGILLGLAVIAEAVKACLH